MFLLTISQYLSEWTESVKGKISLISQFSNKEISLFTGSLLLFSLTFCIIGYMLFRRVLLNQYQIRSENLTSIYQNLLITYIAADNKERARILQALKDCDSDILSAQIYMLKKNFTGTEGLVLDNLYIKLNYKQLSVNKLSSLFWTKRLEGLFEHTLMNIAIPKINLHQLVCDQKSLVRIAALKHEILRGSNWQDILVGYRFSLSKWEQIQLCETIYKQPNFSFKDCAVLKASSNVSVAVLYDMLEQPFTQLKSSDLVSHYEEDLLLN